MDDYKNRYIPCLYKNNYITANEFIEDMLRHP